MEAPWWWAAAPPPSHEVPPPLPGHVDVAIVGAGLTGLNAALTLCRAGRGVALIEAGAALSGASSRNAGFVGRTLKHGFATLLARFGEEKALAIYREAQAAFERVAEIVATEQIACHFHARGRLIAAHSARQYDELAHELELKQRHLGDAYHMMPREEARREIASDAYFGAALIPDLGALHPGLYAEGLLQRARAAGALVVPRTRVSGLRSDRDGVVIATDRGFLRARHVLVATNGYTGSATPWLARRVVPFDAYMIATEALPRETLDRVLPGDRTYIDSNHNIDYLRRSPDGDRILFGGRTGTRAPSLKAMAARLRASLARILPDMEGVRLARAWSGRCAASFDLYPHVGERHGIHYALGYCFAGVPMGSWLGHKAALRILGRRDAATAFDDLGFPTLPFYSGRPWFVPWLAAWYDWRDRRSTR